MPLTDTVNPEPTSFARNLAAAAPISTETTSEPTTPTNTGVPDRVAPSVPSYPLLSAVSPVTRRLFGEMSAVSPVGWVIV